MNAASACPIARAARRSGFAVLFLLQLVGVFG